MRLVKCWNGGPVGWMFDDDYRARAPHLPFHKVTYIPPHLLDLLDLPEFPRPVPASPRADGAASAVRVPSAGTAPGLTGSAV